MTLKDEPLQDVEPIRKHRGVCCWRPPPFPQVDETIWCGRWSHKDNVVTAGIKQSCENCWYFRLGVKTT